MTERTTVPSAAMCAVAGGLACVLLFAALVAGCGKESSPTKSSNKGTAGKGTDTPSAASNAKIATHPETGKSTTEALAPVLRSSSPVASQPDASKSGDAAATAETKQPAVSAADAQLCGACREGRLSDAREALEKGADVNARDENGSAAIMLAAYDGHEAIVRLLIERSADVNAVDPSGRTALMYAASGPNPETVQLLLVNGAKVNVRDREEMYTALMFAASEGQAENVQLLLAHGADRSLVDIDGDAAANFARKNGHTKVVELLK